MKFCNNHFYRFTDDISPPLVYATIVYRLLYDLALDLFDKPNANTQILPVKSPPLSRENSENVCNLSIVSRDISK